MTIQGRSTFRLATARPCLMSAICLCLAAVGCHMEAPATTRDGSGVTTATADPADLAPSEERSPAVEEVDQPPTSEGSNDSTTTDASREPRVDEDEGTETVVADASSTGTDAVSTDATESRKPDRPKRIKPVDPDGVNAVTFDDLEINMDADTVFDRSMLTKQVEMLEDHRVRITGFIHAATILKNKGIKEFLLLKNTECKFGPQGAAHHIVRVKITEGDGIEYTVRPLTVEGTFLIKPWTGADGNSWLIYEMECDKVH